MRAVLWEENIKNMQQKEASADMGVFIWCTGDVCVSSRRDVGAFLSSISHAGRVLGLP